WHHLLFSFDTATPGSMQVYIDGVQDSAAASTFSSAANITFNINPAALGGLDFATSFFVADLTDPWFLFGTALDLSSSALRQKFRSGTGTNASPVYLGPNGTLTGYTPQVYLKGDQVAWLTNSGSDTALNIDSSGGQTIPLNSPGSPCPTK